MHTLSGLSSSTDILRTPQGPFMEVNNFYSGDVRIKVKLSGLKPGRRCPSQLSATENVGEIPVGQGQYSEKMDITPDEKASVVCVKRGRLYSWEFVTALIASEMESEPEIFIT